MPDVIARDGNHATFERIEGAALESAVTGKVLEEAKEFFASESAEELADLYAIVEKAADRFGGMDVITHMAATKREKRGGFDKGLFLLYVEGENLP